MVADPPETAADLAAGAGENADVRPSVDTKGAEPAAFPGTNVEVIVEAVRILRLMSDRKFLDEFNQVKRSD